MGFFAGAFWYAGFLLSPPGRSSRQVLVEIPPGATAGAIGKRLKDAGAVRSATAFTLMVRVLGESGDMKAGEYRLPVNLGVIEIINRLVDGADAESHWVVVPEGKTLRQIAAQLDGSRLVRGADFIRAASKNPKAYGLEVSSSRDSVDGYLMPDTYKVPVKSTERKIVQQFVKNWKEKAWTPNRALFAKNDLPPDKVVILASLIEREARVPEDRELISSVIRNRLRKKMKLQIDATVLYALGRHKKTVSYADLKVDSLFNTYKHYGLPPAPICNPGVASIEAALKPAKTEYLYYVAKPDGSHIFTRTGAEHEAAVVKARELRRAASGGAPKQP